jgi:hypothetical protein
METLEMTAENSNSSMRVRFYGSLEAGLFAWAALMLAIGGTFAIASVPLFIVTLLGMLAILGGAMRHPVYRQLRHPV